MKKIIVGISSCLTGVLVRHDGRHKMDVNIKNALEKHFGLIRVCPEVEYGLPVPREPMHLFESDDGLRLMTVNTGGDHTHGMNEWIGQKLLELNGLNLSGFVFKSGSPSCGLRDVNIYDSSGRVSGTGRGIFAEAFVSRFPSMPVADEKELQDPAMLQRFIDSVF